MFVFPLQHKFGTHAAKIWKNTHMLSGFRSLSNWKEIYGENRRFFYRPDVLRASIFRAEVGQNRLFPTGRRTSGPYLMIFGPFGLIFGPLRGFDLVHIVDLSTFTCLLSSVPLTPKGFAFKKQTLCQCRYYKYACLLSNANPFGECLKSCLSLKSIGCWRKSFCERNENSSGEDDKQTSREL